MIISYLWLFKTVKIRSSAPVYYAIIYPETGPKKCLTDEYP